VTEQGMAEKACQKEKKVGRLILHNTECNKEEKRCEKKACITGT